MLLSKRSSVTVALRILAAVLGVLVALGACQRDEPKNQGEFVFGVVLVGPYNDHGWSEAHYNAGKVVEEKVPGARMIYLDKLNSADRKGVTLQQVVDDMVNDGAKLILTTSDDFAADTDVVAAEHPDIEFVHISGDHARTGKAPDNVANYMGRMYYMKAAAGCAAALQTQTGKVAYLGPLINDETRRLASAAYLGCRYCYEKYRGKNPDELKFTVTWIGFWFNIPGVTLDPTEVTNNMINGGADVIISGIDTTEGIVVAGQRHDKGDKVWAIPYDYEGACEAKPEICLGVPYFNWGPKYVELVKKARAGELAQGWEWGAPYWKNVNDRERSPVGFEPGPALSDAQKKQVEEYIKDLGAGRAKVFVGPLYLQDGTAYLSAGQEANDEQIWYLPQLLRGMEGASF